MFYLLSEYAKLLEFKPIIPSNAFELGLESMVFPTDGNWKRFMDESMVKALSDAVPCTLPPPYEPSALGALIE
ncbi:hypothetical protein RJ639_039294 [Escallonia herrerae]|uniref:Glycosyl transferase CAP10 domain-containing protein n=1 Tax=Escallonia herrerae TaxID=1293975 RepID=A0AA88WLV8_9ASTE|nr:hypothetical protein RJ639_039294 [Escallonia herrerae]